MASHHGRVVLGYVVAILVCTVALQRLSGTFEGPRLELKYVAIVARHGVRAPTWTADRLREYSAEAWPDFGVPAAHLTPAGRQLTTRLGSYYRAWLLDEGLLRRSGCDDTRRLFIWADTDQRTIESGRALSESILPDCGAETHSLAGAGTDPLFDPIESGAATPDAVAAQAAVRNRLGDPAAFVEKHRAAFRALDAILTGGAEARRRPFYSPAPTDVVIREGAVELSGPLGPASTLSEVLLLEYTNGFRGHDLGWGRLTADNLRQVLALHTAYADLIRRTPYMARARSSNLLDRLLKSMQQAATGEPVAGALGGAETTVLVIAGHDTNVSNLSSLLNVSWTVPGYPTDDAPPGGAIVFSLWRDRANNRDLVRLRFVTQTPDQMRDQVALTLSSPPAVVDLPVPGCGNAAKECDWASVARAVRSAIDPAFVPAPAR